MSSSRNVNLDKITACHEDHEGSTDCNVVKAGSVVIIERSIIGGGLILSMVGQWM